MGKAAIPIQWEIGVVGLDWPGRRVARALAEHRLSVAAYDHNVENIQAWREEAAGLSIEIAASMTEFMGMLGQRRIIVLTGPDADGDLLSGLLGQLEAGDLLIDAGNCHFKECDWRARSLAARNIRYLGMGITCGGEAGCFGPVLMVGGHPESYHSVQCLLESVAAKGDGQPCVSHLGPAVAGPFVKMIHDGIEHGLRQIVLETLDLLKRALVLDDDALRAVTRAWQMGALEGSPRDVPARWTSQVAHELAFPAPTIEAAVGMRRLSELEKKNEFATTPFRQPMGYFSDDTDSILAELHGALRAAIMITYAQGIALLTSGAAQYGFDIDVAEVIRLWKGCCKMRVALLDEMASAIAATPDLPNLLHDEAWSEKVMQQQERLRHAVWRAGPLQTSVPALTASLDYLDSYRGAWLPVNLVQVAPRPHAALARR